LSGLNLFGKDANEQIEFALERIKSTTFSIEDEIDRSSFRTPEDEIYFFRHIKPPLYSMHIAFSKLRKIELQRPACSKKKFKVLVKQKLDFIEAHYIDYPEFTRYYNSNSTYDDERYFLRSNKIQLDCFPHLYNDKFSTGYDLIAAYLLAYQFLIDHFDQNDKKAQSDVNNSNISWTADKIAFVELISGLQIMGSVNLGKNDLKTLCSQLGQALNIEVKDIYGKRNEIKERKGDRFKFIRQMLEALEQEFDENFE
jgi:hypothetical protein